MQIKEMFRRASKYMEHGLPPQGLRWFKAAELVIGHNHELTREEIASWQTEWDGIHSLNGKDGWIHGVLHGEHVLHGTTTMLRS
jgi:hypothetical protein